ncbi:MAG: PD-(D/E)XK nuclease family protein, partial [Bacteroidota bacterium]|nr:PD-(D/E)XK nuclease family protein [Bacteroidota bacterium]
TNPATVLTENNKEAFQAIFYAYLYHKSTGASSIQPKLLILKDINTGYQTINGKDMQLTSTEFDAFEKMLRQMLCTILSPQEALRQTQEEEICAFCDYNTICLR